MVVVVDYGLGNLRSVLKALIRLKAKARISTSAKDIRQADKLILPGVGQFASGMQRLHELGYINLLNEQVLEKQVPILGICLGLQLFARHSEEGDVDGLGWIDAQVLKFNVPATGDRLRVPHMGWNTVVPQRENDLFTNLSSEDSYYFVHSYHLRCDDPADVLGKTTYGSCFDVAVQRENIVGTQFHPEKSHNAGLTLLNNFLRNF